MKILPITATYQPAYIYGCPNYSVSAWCEVLVKRVGSPQITAIIRRKEEGLKALKNDIIHFITTLLDLQHYDFVILNGYKNSYAGLTDLCKQKNIPIALRIDSVLYNLNPLKKFLKRIYLPFAYRKFDHFFAVGSETKKNLTWLGISPQKINYFSYATHDEWFNKMLQVPIR